MKRIGLLLFIFCFLPCLALAKEAKPLSNDPELEKRLMALSEQLRCLVCQNETLAGSQADLAEDLRGLIREQMKAGKSDKEIVAYLTDRYGKFILYNPPVDPTTYLLWFGPFVFLLAGLVFLFRYLKQRRELITEEPLSAAERRRAETLLKTAPGKETA
ncbi:MAG TPA: cytochrome c-type biogenesis protein [Pyrinomonadaceae bacterium]|jgi:cytochrome c-type biogenesis protein CcmH